MLTGESTHAARRGALARWVGALAALDTRYFAVDGGWGAAVLVELAAAAPGVMPTDAPRHADVLVVVEPVSTRMMPALAETYRDMDFPPLVVIDATDAGAGVGMAKLEEHLPVVSRSVVAEPRQPGALRAVAGSIRDAARSAPRARLPAQVSGVPVPDEVTLAADERGREIATEDVIVSIGPIQVVTAGPCRFLLTMDGEQVVQARTDASYAMRGLERALAGRSLPDALALAPLIDPLAPVAGRLLLVQALEQLRATAVPADALGLRNAALRMERAHNHLVWLTRFAALLAHEALEAEARTAATLIARAAIPADAVVPGGWNASAAPLSTPETLGRLRERVLGLHASLEASRLIALRTRGVGELTLEAARRAGASGPVLTASARGAGDSRDRMLTRVRAAADDLLAASEVFNGTRGIAVRNASAELHGAVSPAGVTGASSAVEGPRGVIEMSIARGEADTLAHATWTRPSLKHLSLVPELIAGFTLPDALVAIASLDLSMAEADG